MILLDLYSEARPQYARFESYYGHHYIWNMLHDFGGINNLFGSLVNVTAVGVSLTLDVRLKNDMSRVRKSLVISRVI